MGCSMKILAMYLPQYHRVKENDLWWGNGYTDWTAVKKAESLYDGHIQPRVPLNEHYYDLLEKSEILWQAQLLKKYNVDGICMYHYWFKDGKRILEKPEQNLLEWKDVDMPFCFSWANDRWARSWAKIPAANAWAIKFENSGNTGVDVLLEQDYGDIELWRRHFYYLLPYFKDSRYIRVNNKPLFHIYLTYDIECLDLMITEWRRLAYENGLDGLYIIGSDVKEWQKKYLDAILLSEPNESTSLLSSLQVNGNSKRYTYDQLWSQILLNSYQRDIKTYYEGITGLDETPRQGNYAYITEHATPDRFGYYFGKMIRKSVRDDNELLFINAWNEWGEGMYLEPDETYGYGYLEALQEARNQSFNNDNEYVEELYKLRYEKNKRADSNIKVLFNWIEIFQIDKRITDSLIYAGITHVAIYGMGILGRLLYRELKRNGIEIDYLIDQNKSLGENYDERVYSLEEELPVTELIIISVTGDVSDVMRDLNRRKIETCSLEEMIEKLR